MAGYLGTKAVLLSTTAANVTGATERSRLGVRYPELLAFIIGAM